MKKSDDECYCDFCHKQNVSGHVHKKGYICNECMDDMLDLFKTHYMVKRTMSICKQIEEKIKEIKQVYFCDKNERW